MEAHLFVYTRTKHFDYRLMYSPNNQFVPNDIKWEFIDFVREAINEDNVLNGEISEPRWCFYKIGKFVLWGIGCRNSMIGSKDSDYTGTKIRGFYGQIFRCVDGEIPFINYTIEFYKELFKEKIVPIFETKNETDVNSIDSQWNLTEQTGNSTFPGHSVDNLKLNLNNGCTRIFPCNVDINYLVCKGMAEKKVNFVSGLNNEMHAKNAESCHLQNITVIGNVLIKDVTTNSTNLSEREDERNNSFSHTEIKRKSPAFKLIENIVDKIIDYVNKMSTKFNLSPCEIFDHLFRRVKKNDVTCQEIIPQTQEAESTVQPFEMKKANRDALAQIRAQHHIGREKDDEESENDIRDSELSPIKIGNKSD